MRRGRFTGTFEIVAADKAGGGHRKMGPVRAAQVSRLIASGWRTSHTPNHQSTLSTRRVTLDPVDGLPGQAGLLGDPSDAYGLLTEHGTHLPR